MPRKTLPLGYIPFAANQQQDLEIPRVGLLTGLVLLLKYTVTNGAVAPVGPLWETLSRLLVQVQVEINGRDTIVAMDGPGLVARARFEQGLSPYGVDTAVVLGAGVATTYTVAIPVPLTLPRCASPMLTALPLDQFGRTVLRVTFGPSDCSDFYATPNAAAISAVTLQVEAEYIHMYDAAKLTNPYARTLTKETIDIAASNSDFKTIIDTGSPQSYRSILAVTTEGNVAVDTVLTEMGIVTGTYVFSKSAQAFVKAENRKRFMMDTVPVGNYMLSTEVFGDPSLWINVNRQLLVDNLSLQAQVTKPAGVTKLILYREAIRALR